MDFYIKFINVKNIDPIATLQIKRRKSSMFDRSLQPKTEFALHFLIWQTRDSTDKEAGIIILTN